MVAANLATNSYGIAEAEVALGLTPGTYTTTATAGNLSHVFTASARIAPFVTTVANAGTADPGTPVAPGSFIAIFGSALSDVSTSSNTPQLPLAMNQVLVSFDVPSAGISVPGHLTFVSPTQVNIQVPWELAGQTSAQVKVTIGTTCAATS